MAQSKLPPFSWSANNHADTWRLLAEMQKPENAKVLFGKQRGENTSGDSKSKVYSRIAKEIKPTEFAIDAKTTAARVKHKADELLSKYKHHSAKLRTTGGGIGGDEDENEVTGPDHFLDCYIPADGPDDSMTTEVKNIWEQIVKDFPFFPELHHMWCHRASVIPPTITTGVGPVGRVTLHTQPSEATTVCSAPSTTLEPDLSRNGWLSKLSPDHPIFDPGFLTFLNTQPQTPSASQDSSSNLGDSSTPTPQQTMINPNKENIPVKKLTKMEENSQLLAQAVANAKATLKKTPAKRSFVDQLADMSENHMRAVAQRDEREHSLKRRKLALAERQQLQAEKAQLIKLYELNILSKEKLRKKLRALDKQVEMPPAESEADDVEGTPWSSSPNLDLSDI